MNKKLLSLVLALVMVFSVFTTLFAEEETTEATETAPVTEEYIEFLKEHKLIIGDAKGDLMLDKEIDRASFATLLVRADDKEATAVAVKSLGSRFKDMTPAHWANGYANVASEQGWMKGNEKGEFMPSKTISYAEIATTLVRFLGTDDAGYVYPASYIAKAFELGLFEGVREITDYAQPAIRKDIFRMIYNAISKEDFGRYTVYKMIVLENNRVAQLKANEIKAEVLSVVQMPNKVGERGIGKVGEQFLFNLEGLKLDPEFMLGKVANFSIDEKGNLVKVVVDDSYDYVWGGFTKDDVNEKNFAIAGRNYGVRVDERYWNGQGRRFENDDRMYRTYVTSGYRADNYHYVDFVKAFKDKKITPNLARVTAKDGMVIFIDTFELKDIAPVKEVARDGKDVYYYNDAKNGAVERMTPANRVIGYTEKDGFHVMSAKDIKVNDVIHWMSGFTLVRRDAEVTDKLVKTILNRYGEWAVIGENEFFLNSKACQDHPFVSVYAYDNTNFRALQNRGDIDDMRGDDVLALLDVFGRVQLITSHRKYTEAVALINKVVSSHGIEYYAPNMEENYRLADNYDADYYAAEDWNNTRTRRLDAFNLKDLVFVQSADEDQIALTAVIKSFRNDKGTGYDQLMEPAKFESNYSRFLTVGTKDYRFDDSTDVFGYDEYGFFKMDMASVIKHNKKNADLEAWVLTEKEYKHFLEKVIEMKTYNRYSDRDDRAKVVIFRNVEGPGVKLGAAEYGKVVAVNNYANTVSILTDQGNVAETFIILNKAIDFTDNSILGKFVEFNRRTDAEEGKEAAVFTEIIDPLMTCETIKTKYYDGIETAAGVRIYFDQYTRVFGDTRHDAVRVYKLGSYAEVVEYVKECKAGADPVVTGPVTFVTTPTHDTSKGTLKVSATEVGALTKLEVNLKNEGTTDLAIAKAEVVVTVNGMAVISEDLNPVKLTIVPGATGVFALQSGTDHALGKVKAMAAKDKGTVDVRFYDAKDNLLVSGTLNVEIKSNEAKLKEAILTLDGVEYKSVFDGTDYKIFLPSKYDAAAIGALTKEQLKAIAESPATIADPSTDIKFTAPKTYTVTVTAEDGTTTDDVDVIVENAPVDHSRTKYTVIDKKTKISKADSTDKIQVKVEFFDTFGERFAETLATTDFQIIDGNTSSFTVSAVNAGTEDGEHIVDIEAAGTASVGDTANLAITKDSKQTVITGMSIVD